ncbi:ADS3, partial [Symbiodinium pilosum]
MTFFLPEVHGAKVNSIPSVAGLALASVTARSSTRRRAASSKGPPAWAREDLRYVYPFSNGVEAFSYEPATKRHTIDYARTCWYVLMHVIAFTCGPATFSVPALLLCVGLFVSLQTLGISLSYHRHLTHRSFQCHKYFEYFIAYCGALNMQGNPIWWTMNHTWHHRFSDTPWDPHTPREGLWTAHAGWFFEKERILTKMPEAIVVSHNYTEPGEENEVYLPWFYRESPEFYDFLRETYYLHHIALVILLYMLGGWSFVVWGFVVRFVVSLHGVSAVNSFAHVWGEAPFKTGDDSKNNVWVAMVSS